MAPLRTVLALGIIILLMSQLSESSPSPDEQTVNKVSTQNREIKDENTAQEDEPVANSQANESTQRVQTEKTDDLRDRRGDYSNSKSQGEKEDDTVKTKFPERKQRWDDQSDCADDITRLCPEIPSGNNFALLVCLQEKAKEDDLTTECHHMLWEYKRTFAKDQKFEKAVQERFCVADLKLLSDCQKPGQIVACLVEHRQTLTVPSCKHMMTKIQAIFFSDFHLISHFLDNCANDVNEFKCGRIPTEDEEEDIHSQNDVLKCLEEYQEKLSQECQKQIYRLAELSSDDYHLDRPLYYACKDDRKRFCAEIPSGEGRVYKCLKQHKFEETMSDEVSCSVFFQDPDTMLS